jgi:translation elongation factor EF-4
LTIFLRSKTLPQAEFTSAEDVKRKGGPQRLKIVRGSGKKKMRTLGTVQVPTEAFMAVLKLDD